MNRPKRHKEKTQKQRFLINKRIKSNIKIVQFSEVQGRDWRFRCMTRLYIAEQFALLVLGHTATDRAETAFLQLIRGTSFHGILSLKVNKTFKSLYPKYFNYSAFF